MTGLSGYFSVGRVISLLLHPFAEVVIHDLRTGRIASIFNNLSKRKVGDASLLEEVEGCKDFPDVFPVYIKTNWDGKKMKSSTATLRDDKGNPIGFFCINLDVSKWEEMHHLLGEWLGNLSAPHKPEILFKDDWKEKINMYVAEYLKSEGMTLQGLSNEKKRALVGILHREGAFQAKHAASYVADVLDLSRATIYNYLR